MNARRLEDTLLSFNRGATRLERFKNLKVLCEIIEVDLSSRIVVALKLAIRTGGILIGTEKNGHGIL